MDKSNFVKLETEIFIRAQTALNDFLLDFGMNGYKVESCSVPKIPNFRKVQPHLI